MPVIKGQDLLARKNETVISFKDLRFQGGAAGHCRRNRLGECVGRNLFCFILSYFVFHGAHSPAERPGLSGLSRLRWEGWGRCGEGSAGKLLTL